MFRLARTYNIALFILMVVGLPAQSAWTQDAKQPKPIFSVDGFDYKFFSSRKIHAYFCRAPNCIPGSKVTYTIYGPEKNPDFEQYKLMQKRVQGHLSARASEGTQFTFEEPEQSTNELFTIFTNVREKRNADGSKLFTKSTVLFAKTITISLISSSDNKDAVEANRALFMINLMVLAELANKQT